MLNVTLSLTSNMTKAQFEYIRKATRITQLLIDRDARYAKLFLEGERRRVALLRRLMRP